MTFKVTLAACLSALLLATSGVRAQEAERTDPMVVVQAMSALTRAPRNEADRYLRRFAVELLRSSGTVIAFDWEGWKKAIEDEKIAAVGPSGSMIVAPSVTPPSVVPLGTSVLDCPIAGELYSPISKRCIPEAAWQQETEKLFEALGLKAPAMRD